MLILLIWSQCEICPLATIPVCREGGGGGGADDKFVTPFVKEGYGLVSVFSQPYHTRHPASCDMAGYFQTPGRIPFLQRYRYRYIYTEMILIQFHNINISCNFQIVQLLEIFHQLRMDVHF